MNGNIINTTEFTRDFFDAISRQKKGLEEELRQEYWRRQGKNIVKDVRKEVSDNWHFYSTFAVVMILAYVVYKRL